MSDVSSDLYLPHKTDASNVDVSSLVKSTDVSLRINKSAISVLPTYKTFCQHYHLISLSPLLKTIQLLNRTRSK